MDDSGQKPWFDGGRRIPATMLLEGVAEESSHLFRFVGVLVVEFELSMSARVGLLHDCPLFQSCVVRFFGLVFLINRATLFSFFPDRKSVV